MNEIDAERSRMRKLELGFRATTGDFLCKSAREAMAENIAACETGDDIVDVRLGAEGVMLIFAPGGSLNVAVRHLRNCGFPIEKVQGLNGLFMPWSPAQRQEGTPQGSPWGGAERTDLSQGNDLGTLWLSRSAARNLSLSVIGDATAPSLEDTTQ